MSPSEVLLAVGATVLGGLVRGFAGFGAAMVIVPLLSLIWAPQKAQGITLQQLQAANPSVDTRKLKPGVEIRVP